MLDWSCSRNSYPTSVLPPVLFSCSPDGDAVVFVSENVVHCRIDGLGVLEPLHHQVGGDLVVNLKRQELSRKMVNKERLRSLLIDKIPRPGFLLLLSLPEIRGISSSMNIQRKVWDKKSVVLHTNPVFRFKIKLFKPGFSYIPSGNWSGEKPVVTWARQRIFI